MPPETSRELLVRHAPRSPGAAPSVTDHWRELWRHRELFFFLAWRDTLVRYKQTSIGIAWAAIKAIVTVTVLATVFGLLARLPSHGVPYPLMVLAAILPWQFLSSALTDAGNSLVNNSELVSKVYFPRLIIPASAVVVNLVDLFIAGIVLAGLFAWYGLMPDWRVLTLPFFILLAMAIALGAGLWFAALTAQFRDFRHILALLLQLGLYVSPVGFSSSIVPEHWRALFSLNPVVGVIEGFRWALLGGAAAPLYPALPLSILVATLLLVTGMRYYRSAERRFADVI
jgi:lipopolysaccharide transport system permease protein